MYMMITGPPNPLDSLHPLPGKCAEQIKIRRHYFSKVWRIREFNLRLSLQKKLKGVHVKILKDQCHNTALETPQSEPASFQNVRQVVGPSNPATHGMQKGGHPQLRGSLFINVPIYGGWLL